MIAISETLNSDVNKLLGAKSLNEFKMKALEIIEALKYVPHNINSHIVF